MIRGRQMLCGVVLMAVLTAGLDRGATALEIRLHSGTPLEERGRDQLHRLLHAYDPTQPSDPHPQHALRR